MDINGAIFPFLEASTRAQEIFAKAFLEETGLLPSEAEMVIRTEYAKDSTSQVMFFRRRQPLPLNPIASPSTITETPQVTQAFGTDHSETP